MFENLIVSPINNLAFVDPAAPISNFGLLVSRTGFPPLSTSRGEGVMLTILNEAVGAPGIPPS